MKSRPGTRVASATAHGKHGHSLISDAKFRQLYELALKLQRVSGGASGDGAAWLREREAALAGAVADLRASDVVVAKYAAAVEDITRGRLAPGMDARSFEERAIEALSDAVSDRLRKTGRITAIFFDGRRSGILDEARALAVAAKLPVLFVEHPQRRGRAAAKGRKRAALEYPSIPVDIQDVIAMYRVAHESIARAREGAGPTHIVGVRWKTAASGRRKGAKAESQDAVEHLEEWLMARGLPAQQWRRELFTEFAAASGGQSPGVENAAHGALQEEDARTRAIA